MILIIDNYDSFTFNLEQYIGEIEPNIDVVKNDQITIEKIKNINPSHIVISPGPGWPKNAGISEDVIKKLSGIFPILGVCLGHQGIGEVYGLKIDYAPQLVHGKNSLIDIDTTSPLFINIPNSKIKVARYHSLCVKKDINNKEIKIIATDGYGEIMAIQHNTFNTYGVQFHPESIMTEYGKIMIKNFLNIKSGIR
jgi:anthranilate synthase component 2